MIRFEIDSRVADSNDLIKSLDLPPSDELREVIESKIASETKGISDAIYTHHRQRLAEEEAEKTFAEKQLEQCRNFLAELRGVLQGKPVGIDRLVSGSLLLAGLGVCLYAEWLLNIQAIGFLFDLERQQAAVLGLAATATILYLKIALGRLVEEPWRRSLASDGPPGPRRRMVAVTLVVTVGNLVFLGLMGETRAIFFRVLGNIEKGVLEGGALISSATLALALTLSLLLAINGAYFYLEARSEITTFFRRASARWGAWRAECHARRLEKQCLAIQKRIDRTRLDLDSSVADTTAENYRQARVFQLVQAIQRLQTLSSKASFRELSDHLLKSRLSQLTERVH
ncbi:MAG TPA: hypothetical protein VLU25_17175 [Acidobacteriota bacterium]|nr:hypothetical protein [Acidobacteriota bacterium]